MMNNYDYSTAADYARLSGHHRTTIVKWIKQGKISAINKTVKSKKSNYNKHWKIAHKSILNPIKKKNPKNGTTWKTEKHILLTNIDKPIDVLQKLLPNRTKSAIKIMKCRIKKAAICG